MTKQFKLIQFIIYEEKKCFKKYKQIILKIGKIQLNNELIVRTNVLCKKIPCAILSIYL